jgi:addiction module HigA family antidote
MVPENRLPTHPGEVLSEEFLVPMGIPQTKFANHLGIPVQRVNEIVNGKRGVSAETAWLFAEAFGTSPEFWTNLQTAYDLATSRPERHVERLPSAAAEVGGKLRRKRR